MRLSKKKKVRGQAQVRIIGLFRAGTSLGWGSGTLNQQLMSCSELVLTTCCLGMTIHHDWAWAADARGTTEPAFKNVPIGWRAMMVTLKLDINHSTNRSSWRGASGLRVSHNRRGLQIVQLSVRRGRVKLRANTPRHFRAAPAILLRYAFRQVFWAPCMRRCLR